MLTCVNSAKDPPKMFKETAVLHPIPVKTEVWHQIGIDLVGPLKLKSRENRYALFISCIQLLVGCLCTKYCYACLIASPKPRLQLLLPLCLLSKTSSFMSIQE